MEQVLGNVLKVNSIDVFPQTKDKPNAFTRVKSDESAYELVSNNELLAEMSNNKKDWGCINSQLDIPFDLVTNATPVSNQYTVVASSNALPDTDINNIVTTTVSFNEAQTYPMEVARVADYPAGFYRFGGYCSAEDFVIYITYENDDTQIVPYDQTVEIKQPFKRVTYRVNACANTLIMSCSIYDIFIRLFGKICNLEVTFGNGVTKTFEEMNDLIPKPNKHFEKVTSNFTEGRYWFKTDSNAYIKTYDENDWEIIATHDNNPVVYLKSFYAAQNCEVYKEVDGEIESLDDLISEDSLYIQESQNVYLKEDGTAYLSNGKMFMQSTEPNNPSLDDRWYDTKQLPLYCYRYNGTSWEICNEVLIGNVNIINGVPERFTESLLNYNGTLFPLNAEWQFNGNGYVYHNLNIDPERFEASCSYADDCYLTRDVVGLLHNKVNSTFWIRAL